jgi:hypothetical protein
MGVAAALAWFGASIIVLSDGRRGLALGLALAAAGLATLAAPAGGLVAVGALGAGGAAASVARLGAGPPGWGLMPAGSTPRLVLCLAAGLVGLWFAGVLTSGPDAALRFAVPAVAGMMCIRVVTSDRPPVVLTSVTALGLVLASAAGLASSPAAPAVCVAAGLLAAGVGLVRDRRAQGSA